MRRYERAEAGRDDRYRKKLGRLASRPSSPAIRKRAGPYGAGWEFVHVCIDDASRIAFSQILPDERQESAIAFLKAAVAYYASLGVTVARVMTDNGSCYRVEGLRPASATRPQHVRTRPYTPKTNGKAERLVQTLLREWAYAMAYPTPTAAPPNCPSGCTIQSASPARQPKIRTAHQPPRSNRGQPVEAPQLERRFRQDKVIIRYMRSSRVFFRDNGLTITLATMFLFSTLGMIWSGYSVYNEELRGETRRLSFFQRIG